MAGTKGTTKGTKKKAAGRSGSKGGKRDASSRAAPAVPRITKADIDKAAMRDVTPLESMPGWMVTVTGTCPKVLCQIVLRKSPIRASSKESAVGRFMQEVASLFKKPELFDPDHFDAVEVSVPKQPGLDFKPHDNSDPPDPPEPDEVDGDEESEPEAATN